jgi:hypothetical protein
MTRIPMHISVGRRVLVPFPRYYISEMKLSLFKSTTEADLFGYTADPSGGNLPAEFGPWLKAGEGSPAEAHAGQGPNGLSPSDPISTAVARDGFYLVRSGVPTHSPSTIH